MPFYTQTTLPFSLDQIAQYCNNSKMRIKFFAAIIRNNKIKCWANNQIGCHAEQKVIRKLQTVHPKDILLIYRQGKDHSYPCNQALESIRQSGIKFCAFWGKKYNEVNNFMVLPVSRMQNRYESFVQRKLEGKIPCFHCDQFFSTQTEASNHGRVVHNGRNELYKSEDKNDKKWEIGKNLQKKEQLKQNQLIEFIVPPRRL